MFFKKKDDLWKKGLTSAAGVAGYIMLVSTFFYNANRWFGKEDNFMSPIVALSLFVFSALTCSLIVFAEPYRLFVDKKGKEALTQVIWTAKWLGLFLILAMLSLLIW